MPSVRKRAEVPVTLRPAASYSRLAVLAESFRRSLRAANRAPMTVKAYLSAIRLLEAFLVEKGMPTDVQTITREYVESFILDQLARLKPASANNRYRSLQAFFKWCVEEGEAPRSPMERMKPPSIPEQPAAVLTEAQLRKLIAACVPPRPRKSTRYKVPGFDVRIFESIRDEALIRVLHDTGMRRSECASLRVQDLDWDNETLQVLGKGSRPRPCTFGRKVAKALDRYLRARARHPQAASEQLWLGQRGPLTGVGIYKVVRDRAEQAGIGKAWTHLMRHTFSHGFLAAG